MTRAFRSSGVVAVAVALISGACGGSNSGPGASGGSPSGGGGSGAAGDSGAGSGGASATGGMMGGTGGGAPAGGGFGANPPSIPCPDELPAEASECVEGYWGKSCEFVDPCGGPDPFYANCDAQTATWHLMGDPTCGCNPNPICPTTPPEPGSACDGCSNVICIFPCADGTVSHGSYCVNDVWVVEGTPCPVDAGP